MKNLTLNQNHIRFFPLSQTPIQMCGSNAFARGKKDLNGSISLFCFPKNAKLVSSGNRSTSQVEGHPFIRLHFVLGDLE